MGSPGPAPGALPRRLGLRREAIAPVPDRDHCWHDDRASGGRDRDYGRAPGGSRDRLHPDLELGGVHPLAGLPHRDRAATLGADRSLEHLLGCGGTFLGIASPKAWVAIAAVFASGHLADDTTTDAAAKIAVLTAMIIAICALWLVAGTSIAPLLRNPGRARVVNAALAVALVGATALAVLH